MKCQGDFYSLKKTLDGNSDINESWEILMIILYPLLYGNYRHLILLQFWVMDLSLWISEGRHCCLVM